MIAGPSEQRPSLTDVDGILVGQHTDPRRPTGCTVVTSSQAFTAGVDVRGGAPGTFDLDVLRSENLVEQVHAIFLAGGSAFGLGAAAGVSRCLEERGLGFPVGDLRVPVVCGAILFDLALGDAGIRPDADAGYQACRAAGPEPVAEGNVGAGAGATVGAYAGRDGAMKGGLGSWALSLPGGLQVGALVAVNAIGDIIDPSSGRIIAGARRPDGSGFLGLMPRLREGWTPGGEIRSGTVIAIVATNAALTKSQCNRVAQMAQDALARCINPAHTQWDGDTVFALSTGRLPSRAPADVGIIGALAADVLAAAILRGVRAAESWGPYPSCRDFPAATR
ncbi:MAG: P1 family peptidase [Acidobacteria bacterium]|nr:P1 family peptidase [Acidobacteriota bacterium]